MERDYPIYHEEDEETPKVSRSPLEVMRDWWEDRQRMIDAHEHEDDDDEEEDDTTDSPKKRFGKSLRNLFVSTVEKAPVEVDAVPVAAEFESADEIIPPLPPFEPLPAMETVLPDIHEEVPEVTEQVFRTEITPGVPPTVVEASETPEPVAAEETPVIEEVPTPTTVIERGSLEEHHYHNRRSALAALVVAERIDHHRDKKRKRDIKAVQKTQKTYEQKTDKRLTQLEQPTPEPQAVPLERPRVERPIEQPKPAVVPTEQQPAPLSRPQSVNEVLEARQTRQERPVDIRELEHNRPRTEQRLDQEDILVTAEKLASQVDAPIAHEVYDERWHEIKDDPTTVDTSAVPKGTIVSSEPTASPTLPAWISSASSATPSLDDKTSIAQPAPVTPQPAFSGVWAALIVGVVVAIIVILMG